MLLIAVGQPWRIRRVAKGRGRQIDLTALDRDAGRRIRASPEIEAAACGAFVGNVQKTNMPGWASLGK